MSLLVNRPIDSNLNRQLDVATDPNLSVILGHVFFVTSLVTLLFLIYCRFTVLTDFTAVAESFGSLTEEVQKELVSVMRL